MVQIDGLTNPIFTMTKKMKKKTQLEKCNKHFFIVTTCFDWYIGKQEYIDLTKRELTSVQDSSLQ